MAEQVKNSLDNPTSTLAAGITSGALSLTVAAGHGARLPATGDFRLKLTDQSDDTLYELVVGTARATDVVTVTRAAEGTTARAFVTGDHVDLVLSAAALTAYVTENSAADADVTASTAASVILAPASSARNVIQPTAGTVIDAIFKAHAAQSVDLTQWQDSAGAVVARFTKDGVLKVDPLVLADSTAAAEFHHPSDLSYAVAAFADDVSSVTPQIFLAGGGYPAMVMDHGYGFAAGTLSSSAVLMGRKGVYGGTRPAFSFGMEADSDSAGRAYLYAYSSVSGSGYAWNVEWPESQIVLGTKATTDIPGRVNIRGYGARTTEHMLDIKAIASFAADYLRARDSTGALVFRVNKNGIPLTLAVAAPADGDVSNSEGGWWWDQANSLPKWKGKTSGGVVVNFVPADATALADHIADTADAHDASAISFSPTGTVAATDVQAAIAEVASEAAGGGIPATIVDAKGDLIAATAADTVARLAVGSNDQVLTADSAQATGLKWAAAGGGISATIFDANTVLKADTDDTPVALAMAASTILARLASGNIKAASVAEIATLLGSYAFTTGIVYASGYIGSGFGGVVDRMDLTAFPAVYQATTFDRIGIYCNNATATAVVRLGIYNDVGGAPDTLVLDAGTVDCSTTGEKTKTISQLLPPGRYWLAAVPQVAVAASAYDLATRGNDFSSGGVGGVFYHAIKYGGMFTHSAAVSGALPASTASWVQDGGIRVAMRAA